MAPRNALGRLRRDEEFRRVYRDGARRVGTLVVLHALPNGLGTARLGIAVGRRFGPAVVRNRLRRRLREAVRWHRARIDASADLVLVPRAAAADAAYADLRDGVGAALEAAGLLDHASGGGAV